MRTSARIATTVAVAALAVAAIAGPVSAAPTRKGTTTVVPSALTASVLAGVAKPGYLAGGAVFGITGNPKDGTIEHVGGLYVNGAGGLLDLRNFMEGLRASGMETGGPAAFNHADRQAFANQLDRFISRSAKPAS